jgi:hypothetical protein
MKGKAAWLGVAVMVAVLGIALVGCATGPSSSPSAAKSQADLLKDAGFRTHTAQGAHLAYVKTLPAKPAIWSAPTPIPSSAFWGMRRPISAISKWLFSKASPKTCTRSRSSALILKPCKCGRIPRAGVDRLIESRGG